MKLLFSVLLLSFSSFAYSQSKNAIVQSWVKTSVENLSDREFSNDTFYMRYTFGKSNLNISLAPAWDQYNVAWKINGDALTIGFDRYKIEVLNDTALTISLAGFRRYRFLSETYLSRQKEYLDSIGMYGNDILYKANNFVTPRYTGKGNLQGIILNQVKDEHIVTAKTFLASFIITEKGILENIKIERSINPDFDKEVIDEFLKISTKWKPAYFRGIPINTQMLYKIKFYNSTTNMSSGNTNG
jgi:hypothetical protein